MCELDHEEMKNIEIAAEGAGLGGGFDHISKLKVMKLKEAMNRPDNNKLKEKIENEQKQKAINGVSEPLDKNDLPERAKGKISTWAC